LALLYELVLPAVCSPALARRWFELAAERGHVAARKRLNALDTGEDAFGGSS